MIQDLLKQTNKERENLYDTLLVAKQELEASQRKYEEALWAYQMSVSKIGIMIDQLETAE